jgi:uncharacterized membrane protein
MKRTAFNGRSGKRLMGVRPNECRRVSMKAWKIAIAGVCCCASGALSATSAMAQASQTFQLAVCNISAFSDVYVAITAKADGQRWTVSGWYPIPDSGCTLVGTFPRDTVYYYARGSDKAVWAAPDNDQNGSSQCVDGDKFFTAAAGVPACPAGQQAVRFRMLKAQANQPRVTFTLTGGK